MNREPAPYRPLDPVTEEVMEREAERSGLAVVHYFSPEGTPGSARGRIAGIVRTSGIEKHIAFKKGMKVRLDRIIALNGKPGPAYDEYDSYALACLDCMGGMD